MTATKHAIRIAYDALVAGLAYHGVDCEVVLGREPVEYEVVQRNRVRLLTASDDFSDPMGAGPFVGDTYRGENAPIMMRTCGMIAMLYGVSTEGGHDQIDHVEACEDLLHSVLRALYDGARQQNTDVTFKSGSYAYPKDDTERIQHATYILEFSIPESVLEYAPDSPRAVGVDGVEGDETTTINDGTEAGC